MTPDDLKKMAAQAALEYVEAGTVIGIGTGSTANHFIDGLAAIKHKIDGTVASSEASAKRLKAHGIPVLDLNSVDELSRITSYNVCYTKLLRQQCFRVELRQQQLSRLRHRAGGIARAKQMVEPSYNFV